MAGDEGLANEFIDIDGELSPRLCQTLLGHERTSLMLKQAVVQNKLHHGWLLTGQKGIGKASFAYQGAKFLLSLKPNTQPDLATAQLSDAFDAKTVHLIESGAHPDLFIMNRPFDVKKKDFKKDIPIESARALKKFMTMTSGLGRWRVCIIDCAEDMTPQASNAILKTLEEPSPRTMFFLVSHQPGRLLDTIGSRCQKMPMETLATERVGNLLTSLRPKLDEQLVQAVAYLAQGSIGQALQMADLSGLDIYRDMVDVLVTMPHPDGVKLHDFAGRMAERQNEKEFALFALFLSNWLHALTRAGAMQSDSVILFEGEAALVQRFLATTSLEQWVDVWEKIATLLRQSETLNLDKKQTIIECFSTIRKTIQ